MMRTVARALLFIPAAAVVVAVAAWLSLPWPVLLRWREPDTTSLMRYRVREARAEGRTLELRRSWVPLEEISDAMVRAVVLAEDARFREHGGIDWYALADELEYAGGKPPRWSDPEDREALVDAVRYGWQNRSELRGRSTITQQLAKNLYYTPERSLGRKLGEFVVARRLERFLDKDRILELYLNSVELGDGLFGVDAAAREYFGVPASALTSYQAASLAGTLPHPLTSNPGHRPARMAWRRDRILGRMSGGASADRNPIPEAPPEIDPPVLGEPPPGPVEGAEPVDTAAEGPGEPEGDTTPSLPDTTAPPDTAGVEGPPADTSGAGRTPGPAGMELARPTFPESRRSQGGGGP